MDSKTAELIINDYNCFYIPRSKGRCGGISIYGNKMLSNSNVDINLDVAYFELGCIEPDFLANNCVYW